MSYKYQFKDNMYVSIDKEKFKKSFFKKHSYRTAAEIINKAGIKVTNSGLSTSINRGIVNYGILKIICRDMNMKPATFINSDKPVSDKNISKVSKKPPVKKPSKSKKPIIKEEPAPFTGDGGLNVTLNKKSDQGHEDIIKALNRIGDALRELVEELK